MTAVQIADDVSVGEDGPLLVIAGPCVVEGLEFMVQIAETIRKICERHRAAFMFKASFDKANRSSIDAPRGRGMEEGLATLAAVKEAVGVPVITDIHET